MRLLVVEDSDDDYAILLLQLKRSGLEVEAERVASAAELDAALSRRWDLLVTDWILPGFGGLQALEIVAARGVELPCIVISGTPNEEAAVEALRAGALDFLSKDKPLRFSAAVERALREAGERRARVEAERALRLSDERYRLGFEVAPEALLTFQLDTGTTVDVNDAALRLFGRTRDEMRESSIGRGILERLAGGEKVDPFEWEIINASGEVVPLEVRIVRLPGTNNQIRLTMIDLRPRLRMEEIRRHAAELELQNRRIQEANRLKSEFLANMSHELRTPLNAIIGFTELLFDGQVPPDSPQHGEFLGDILASGRHLLQLINDVLDLAKVEAGKLDFRPEPVELARLIGEVVSITRATAAAKQIALVTDIDPALREVVLDPNRFKQVAYNYLSNALKFTPEGGRVAIRIVPEGDAMFRLEVEDTGPGIAPADLGRLFIEFQQLETGAGKRHQGTGLGLALTRRLVEAQGGSVGVRSTPDKGSVFHAILPRHAVAQDAPAALPLPAARLGARTILVVEDDDRDRAVIVAALASAGYAVEIARDAKEALARCRERTFDAVTLDLLLPDMSGLELLAALRASERMRTTPVIVISVAAEAGQVAGFAVHDVLRKPLDRHALIAALERAGVRPDRAGGVAQVGALLGGS